MSCAGAHGGWQAGGWRWFPFSCLTRASDSSSKAQEVQGVARVPASLSKQLLRGHHFLPFDRIPDAADCFHKPNCSTALDLKQGLIFSTRLEWEEGRGSEELPTNQTFKQQVGLWGRSRDLLFVGGKSPFLF